MSTYTPLIRLKEGLIVHPTEIRKADRCGNYTDVRLKDGGMLMQIWDEDCAVWNAIAAAAEPKP